MEKINTPGQTIRKYCLDCCETSAEVRECQGDKQFGGECVFYRYRLGRGRPLLRVIRTFCLQCMNGSVPLVNKCSSKTCPLIPYRRGKRPCNPEDGFKPSEFRRQQGFAMQEAIRRKKACKEMGK
jgi:hypothetical protein